MKKILIIIGIITLIASTSLGIYITQQTNVYLGILHSMIGGAISGHITAKGLYDRYN